MFKCLLGFVMAVTSGAVGTAHAGAPYLGLDLGDVMVATIKKVSGHAATNGNPPRLELEIHELLRGDPNVDRTRAIWMPSPHGCDFGDPEAYAKFVQAWEAQKLASPKVGDKFVLWGALVRGQKPPVYAAYSWHAYPFSKEKRDWAVKVIRDTEQEARRYAATRKAEKQALAKAQAKWQAKTSVDDLKKYAAEADFVAVGRIVGGSALGRFTLQVQILKGEKRQQYTGGDYFVEVAAPQDVHGLLDRMFTDSLTGKPTIWCSFRWMGCRRAHQLTTTPQSRAATALSSRIAKQSSW